MICNHSIGLIIRYITSLTQYLTYSMSLPQDTFDYNRGVLCVWTDNLPLCVLQDEKPKIAPLVLCPSLYQRLQQ